MIALGQCLDCKLRRRHLAFKSNGAGAKHPREK
jgi:hypothetical protein